MHVRFDEHLKFYTKMTWLTNDGGLVKIDREVFTLQLVKNEKVEICNFFQTLSPIYAYLMSSDGFKNDAIGKRQDRNGPQPKPQENRLRIAARAAD